MSNSISQKITGVPKDKLQSKINQIKADPDYIRHEIISEDTDAKFWTIKVELKVED